MSGYRRPGRAQDRLNELHDKAMMTSCNKGVDVLVNKLEFLWLIKELLETRRSLEDELDNWNPERRPTLEAENREMRLLLEQIANDGVIRTTLSQAIHTTLDRLSADVGQTAITGAAEVDSTAGEPVHPPEASDDALVHEQDQKRAEFNAAMTRLGKDE